MMGTLCTMPSLLLADPLSQPGQGLGVWTPGFHHTLHLLSLEAAARLAVLEGDMIRAQALLEEVRARACSLVCVSAHVALA